jgi:hypothetical protein
MQRPEWQSNAWKYYHHLQPGAQPDSFTSLLVCHRDTDEIVGYSNWYHHHQHGLHWWKLVGSGSICSDYSSLPSEPGVEKSVAVATAQWINDQSVSRGIRPMAIEVDGRRADDPQWQTFDSQLLEAGWSQLDRPAASSWRVDLPSSWNEFEKLLSKSRRRKARTGFKQIEAGQIHVQIAKTADEVASLWPNFVLLHQKRRNQLGQTGCFADSQYGQFLQKTVEAFSQRQSAWLCQLSHEGQPMAILLMFDEGTVSFAYQSGINPELLHLHPGHIVNAVAIRHAIQRGQRAFDFLRGDEHYKCGWAASPIALTRSVFLPPGFAGRAIASAWRLRNSVNQWFQKGAQATQDANDAD